MANIMQCIIGKEFGRPSWQIKFSSPFNTEVNFVWEMTDLAVPFPARNFDHREVEAFRDYLTGIIDEYYRIVADLEQLNG